MYEFIAKHQDKIAPAHSQDLTALVFRGHLRFHQPFAGDDELSLGQPDLAQEFWRPCRTDHRATEEGSLAEATACGRPVKYLHSSQIDKETIARNILAQYGVRSGLVCVLSCVEPCWSFDIQRNREKKKPKADKSKMKPAAAASPFGAASNAGKPAGRK